MAYRKSKKRTKALARARKEEKRREAALKDNPELGLLESQLDILEQVIDGYDQSSDPGSFLEIKLNSLVTRLRSLAKDFDPARVIGVLRVQSFAAGLKDGSHDPLNGEKDYSISLVEAATLALYCGSQIDDANTFQEPAIGIGGLGEVSEKIFDTLRQIRVVITVLQLYRAAQISPQAQIAARHSAARQWIRETTYSPVLMDINHELFSVGRIDDLLTKTRSYSFGEVESVFVWLAHSMNDRFDNARTQLLELYNRRFQLTEVDAEQARQALAQMLAPSFEGVTVSAGEVAQDTGQQEPIVQKILEDFSIDLAEVPQHQVKSMLIEGSNPLFEFPLVRDRENRFLIPDEALLAPAVKRNLETTLLTANASQNVYSNHRGRSLETKLSKILTNFLPQAELLENIKFRSTDGGRGEADLVLLLGDVAIIIEAKAGTILKQGETVTVPKFKKRLHQNIAQASKQVEKMRQVIEESKSIPLERGQPIDLSDIREVHTVIVTLDDLLDLAAQPLDLVDAKILEKEVQLPWIVSLGDLQLILALIKEPSELLVYLRRRRDPVIARKYWSTDELDLFQVFRRTGLWAEDEADAETPELVMSMTSDVDAWFYGDAESPPVMKETPLMRYVRQSRTKELPHWFEFGAALISLDEETQEEILCWIDKMVKQTQTDFKSHKLTLSIGQRLPTQPGCLLVFKTKGTMEFTEDKVRFARYLKAKKTQCDVDRAFACVVDRQGALTDLIYEAGAYSVSNFTVEEWASLIPLQDG